MEKHELQQLIEHLYDKYVPVNDGQVATYIPELGKANPDDFGICLVSSDGRVFEAGNCSQPFTIQSVSKPFTFGMAIEELGHDKVFQRVGVEPSGEPAPKQLADAIREFARREAVPLESSALDLGDFPGALEQVMSAVRLKRKSESWWQKLKRRF